jgi:hypothetical protein
MSKEAIPLSPLPADHVRTLMILAAREGQAAIGRGRADQVVIECFESAASLARDYYKQPPKD